MNKNDLVAAVADKSGLSKADTTKAVDSVFDCITDVLKSGDDVRLVGFGTFNVTKRAASMGRNPRTVKSIKIPASNHPKFKAGKGLKDAVHERPFKLLVCAGHPYWMAGCISRSGNVIFTDLMNGGRLAQLV